MDWGMEKTFWFQFKEQARPKEKGIGLSYMDENKTV
jgi:hypothetical protein